MKSRELLAKVFTCRYDRVKKKVFIRSHKTLKMSFESVIKGRGRDEEKKKNESRNEYELISFYNEVKKSLRIFCNTSPDAN